MQKLRTYQQLVLISFLLLLISCKKGIFYDGINDNPIELKNPTPALLLPPIIKGAGYQYGSDESRFTTTFMQKVTGIANQAVSANLYNISSDDVNNMWSAGFYRVLMNNTYDLMQLAKKRDQQYYLAIGQIMMANLLQRVTDLWGDIPYTEAFKGEESKNAGFDTQESIYREIFSLLNAAISEIEAGDNGANLPGTDDLLYNGNMDKWKKFAYSMKARCFLHLVKQKDVYYDSVLLAMPNAFVSGADDAKVSFSAGGANPTAQFDMQRGDISYKGNLQNMLIQANDPRLNVYYDADDKNYLGALYGSLSSPIYLMTYDELLFIEAEAHISRDNNEAAAIAYNRAIEVNLLKNGLGTAYLEAIGKTAIDITIEDIMTQKYIALFLSPESWADWRRTKIPVLTPPAGNTTGDVVPRALLYPSSELLYNPNTPKGRTLTSRLWWDREA